MDKTPIEHVWIDGRGNLRSKCRLLHFSKENLDITDIPLWDCDGSSTHQATSNNSEITLKPVRIFKCPFRKPNGIIVLCEAYTINGNPAIYNNRSSAFKIFAMYNSLEPWYGLEQEYCVIDKTSGYPIGFTQNEHQKNRHYCSVGYENNHCRELAEEHMEACLYAGINLSGINAEVLSGQWEFQVGPVAGIDAADQLWIARYLLQRIAEKYTYIISYHPKPVLGKWNGSGCHTNFSTKEMRNDGGLIIINNAILKLKESHKAHMEVYGIDNDKRMTGENETSNFSRFTAGISDRTASIRIPSKVAIDGKGYFEDRRPAANCDPYLVTSIILKTIAE